MSKLIVQIPCLNEAATLPTVISGIPKTIPGIERIEILVIDDGSLDNTSEVARTAGAAHVIRNTRTCGLAFSFRRGIDYCLRHGADIIVNMDGDNQYSGNDIAGLIAPILREEADIVIGSRETDTNPEFSLLKKKLQRIGSSLVRSLSQTKIRDTVSGFRAFSREAALRTTVLSNYTYTLESILQVPSKGLAITDVMVQTNRSTRESRLMKNLSSYLAFSAATIIRVFTMYNPLKVFFTIGGVFILIAVLLSTRFFVMYFMHGGAGLVQSLIFAGASFVTGISIILVGLLADLIQFNRRLLEDILERLKRLELK